MGLNRDQIQLIAKTLADVAKLLFASSVIGFFIPGSSGTVSISAFAVGSACGVLMFTASVATLKS